MVMSDLTTLYILSLVTGILSPVLTTALLESVGGEMKVSGRTRYRIQNLWLLSLPCDQLCYVAQFVNLAVIEDLFKSGKDKAAKRQEWALPLICQGSHTPFWDLDQDFIIGKITNTLTEIGKYHNQGR